MLPIDLLARNVRPNNAEVVKLTRIIWDTIAMITLNLKKPFIADFVIKESII